MSDELKPCPFCGNDGSGPIEEALHLSELDMEGSWKATYAYTVQCDKCTGTIGYSESEEEATFAWNTRADLTPTDAQIMAHPKVMALVEAGEVMARALRNDCIIPGSARKWGEALAALEEKP